MTASTKQDMHKLAIGMRRYIRDPVAFVREVLQAEPDDWQVEALQSLVSRGRLAVRSGHGVGKSTFEAWSVLWFLFTRPFPKIICTAPTRQQLYDILWPEISKWMSKSDILKTYFDWQKTRIVMIQEPERWWASARTATNPDNFAGIHEEHVLIVCDEASGIRDAIYEVAEGALTTSDAKIILCGNPTQLSGEFHDAFHSRREMYKAMHVSCIGSPRVTQDYIDNLKKKYGEKSQVYRVRVLGEFPESEPDVLIPLHLVEAATMRDVLEDDGKHTGQIHLGVDAARFGDDEIVVYPRIGPYVFEPHVFYKLRTTELAGNLRRIGEDLCAKYNRNLVYVNIDVGAMGGGVVDDLVEGTKDSRMQWAISEIPFGGEGDKDSDDMATVMYQHTRDLLQEERVQLPDDDKTVAQLTTRKYRVTIKGKLKLESKDDYKKRHQESPDRADALVLCFYEGGVDGKYITTTREAQSKRRVQPMTAGIKKKKF